jgi:hypothetical protein
MAINIFKKLALPVKLKIALAPSFLVLLLLFMLNSPVFPAELVRSSEITRPSWVAKNPVEDDENLWFIGTVPDALALKQGKLDALEKAVGKMLKAFGLSDAAPDFQDKKTRLWTQISAGLSEGGKIDLPGVKILDGYFEEWLETNGKTFYSVYILLSYSRIAFEEQLKIYEEEYGAILEKAASVFSLAKAKAPSANAGSILKDYALAFNMLNRITDISGKQKLLKDIRESTNNLLSNISLVPYLNEAEQSIILGIKTPAMLKAFYKTQKEAVPLKNIPVDFRFIEGAGTLENGTVLLDNAGIARCNILRVAFGAEKTILQAQVRQESADQTKLPVLTFEITPEEGSAIFERGYRINFDSGTIVDSITFSMPAEPTFGQSTSDEPASGERAVNLVIKITAPGSSEDIFLELTVPEEQKKLKKSAIIIPLPDGIQLNPAAGRVSFTAKDLNRQKSWELALSNLKINITVLNYKAKTYYSAFTAPFTGFESLSFKISVSLYPPE